MILNTGIIGSGNVATHLAHIFVQKEHNIEFIYSKNEQNAKELAQKIGSTTTNSLDFSKSKIDILIIAIKDDTIQSLASQIIVSDTTIIAHTSGSISLNTLSIFENAGIFYPLQTFSKDRILDFDEIPILIEANNKSTEEKLMALGNTISKNVQLADSKKRKILHLAAVFTNNFTNALLSISEGILEENNIDKNLLYPLAKETIAKAINIGAKNAQTGPAKRGDWEVQQKHIELLENKKEKEIYKLLSLFIEYQ